MAASDDLRACADMIERAVEEAEPLKQHFYRAS
jgi:hypothetical protein